MENLDEQNTPKFVVNDNELYNYRIVNDDNTKNKIVKKFRIPKSKEIKNILYNALDKRNHGGIYATNYYISNNNIYWINMINDIKEYISKCVTCAKIKTDNKTKKNLCNTILSNGPKDRYVADLYVLPPELNSSHTSYKYVIDIIDHFSKYTESNLFNTKESYEIFPIIKNFIKIHGAPKYLITDKGGNLKIIC